MTAEEKAGSLLKAKGMKLATAESCTGGLIAKRITDVSGSSDYFEMGVVTYSNGAKEALLGVPGSLIAEKGAVSSEVARAMAEGVRERAEGDLGLSVTGIAGPGGGTPEKPVGTVYIGLATREKTYVRKCHFQGDRGRIRAETSEEGLNLVIMCLEGRLS